MKSRTIALVLLSCGLLAGTAAAQCPTDLTCQYLECRSPATAVPALFWSDELKPSNTGTINSLRDNTDFDEFNDLFNHNEPHWMSLDIENGWIFAGINMGLEVWNANPPFQRQPSKQVAIGRNNFPFWVPGASEEKNPVRDIDAPPGYDDVVAMAIVDDIGLAVFDTSVKNSPRALYGDHDKRGEQVYSTTLGGNHYAFMATRNHGLLAYDLTAAEALTTACTEETPAQTGCGVYVGRLGTRNNVYYVDGAGDFVVASSGLFGRGLEIWNVADPANPLLVLSALSTEFVYGVALWQQGDSYWLATRVQGSGSTQARIYGLSCLATGTCGGIGPAVALRQLPSGSTTYLVTHSENEGRHFAYYGTTNRCSVGAQNEWLFEVTNAKNFDDLTPPGSYWGHYYRRNPTGFNRVTPRMGKFNGEFFYRAAFTLFDIHETRSVNVFANGFESGDLGGWPSVFPPLP